MTGALLAVLGWLVVLVPGGIATATLRPRAALGSNAALAPVVGIGLNVISAQVLQWTGASIRWWTVLPASFGASVVIGCLALARLPDLPSLRVSARHRRSLSIDGWMLGLAVAVGSVIWILTIPSSQAVLPGVDGSHHALWTTRIERLHTFDPHVVLAGDTATRSPVGAYYPLAFHLSAALVAQLTGASANTVLTAGMVLAAVVLLPAGTLLLTRRLVAGRPGVPGLAALVAAAYPWFPYAPLHWGGVTLVVGMSMVPIVVDIVWLSGAERPWQPTAVLMALAGYGLFETHNSELVTVALFGLVLIVAGWRGMGMSHRRVVVRSCLAAGLLLVAMILPGLAALRGGAGERVSAVGDAGSRHAGVLAWITTVGNVWILAAVGIGLVVALRQRIARAWLACGAIVGLLVLAAMSRTALGTGLTYAWYGSARRISYQFGYIEAPLAAVGIAAVATAIGRAWRTDRGGAVLVRGLAVTAAAGTFLAFVVSDAAAFLRSAYVDSSLVRSPQRAAFAWLAAHVGPRQRVLNDFVDGSAWMDTLNDVTPLLAIAPTLSSAHDAQATWGDRWYLVTHAGEAGSDRRARAAIRDWNVTYAYFSEPVVAGTHHELSLPSLRASPAWQLAWHRGPVWIFRLVVPGGQAVGPAHLGVTGPR